MREEKPVRLVNRGWGTHVKSTNEFLVSASGCQYERFCIEAIGMKSGKTFLIGRATFVVSFSRDYLNMALISR